MKTNGKVLKGTLFDQRYSGQEKSIFGHSFVVSSIKDASGMTSLLMMTIPFNLFEYERA